MTGARASCHTARVSVKPSPVIPAPAATLVLLRDRPAGGVETLLIQRHQNSRFAAGDHVFPGGRLEADDNPEDAEAWCVGLEAAAAARVLGLAEPRPALGYWIGAIRETFEEVGILLAYGADGRLLAGDVGRLAEHRRACQRDNRAFWTMLRAARLRLATDRLVYFAHWITPEGRPLRFDTRFFAAAMPAGQAAVADEREIVGVRWLTPPEALAAQRAGEISLRIPTATTLGLLETATDTADALARLAAQRAGGINPGRPEGRSAR